MQDEGRYYDTEHGKLPSVTTILGLVNKPALIQWSANCASQYIEKNFTPGMTDEEIKQLTQSARFHYKDVSKEATGLGTEVHDAVEVWLKHGTEPEHGFTDLNGALSFEAFKEWWDSNDCEMLYCEEEIAHPLGFAGRFDLIAKVNGNVMMLDLKTSKNFYEEMGYQLAAYRTAWNELNPNKEQCTGHGIIRVGKEDGNWYFKDYSKSYEKDWEIFKKYLDLFYLLKERKEIKLPNAKSSKTHKKKGA